MVADVLVPIGHQDIGNHRDDGETDRVRRYS